MRNFTHGGVWPPPNQQQPYRYGRREGGRYAVVPYENVSQAELEVLVAQADADGLNYEFSNTFGKQRLEIEYNWNRVNGGFSGQTTESEETWEITPSKVLKDLLDSSNPLVQSVLAETNGAAELNALSGWKRQNTLETNITDGQGAFKVPQITVSGATVNFNEYGIILAKYLYDGVSQVEVAAPVLSHSKVVTAAYIYPAQFLNLGRIISTSTLISSEGIPTAVLFDFPSDTDPSPQPIGTTGYHQNLLYGWLKNSPSVRQVSKKKWNITQTWDYGLWGIELYGGSRL